MRLRISLILLAACNGGIAYEGTPGELTPAAEVSNIMFVPTRIDGVEGPHLGLDTGAPINIVAPAFVGRFGNVNVARLEVGSLAFLDLPVMGDGFFDAQAGGIRLAGLIGCTVLCQLGLTIDYRTTQIAIGLADPPPDVAQSIEVPFRLLGGASGLYPASNGERFRVTLPQSRIIVEGTIESRPVTLLFDTGASAMLLEPALADELLADGRRTTHMVVGGMGGVADLDVFRLRSMSVGEASLENAVAMRAAGAFAALLSSVETETREDLDGLVGGTFLRAFFLRVDYGSARVRLSRYPNLRHVRDEGLMTGVVVSMPNEVVLTAPLDVIDVRAGSDAAAQGVTAPDRLIAVDGTMIVGLPIWELQPLLTGQLGDVREMVFETGGTRRVQIDYDALALP